MTIDHRPKQLNWIISDTAIWVSLCVCVCVSCKEWLLVRREIDVWIGTSLTTRMPSLCYYLVSLMACPALSSMVVSGLPVP